MFRRCKCGVKGGSVAPLRSSGVVPWVCNACRRTPPSGVKRMTISATITSYREVRRGKRILKFFLKQRRTQ